MDPVREQARPQPGPGVADAPDQWPTGRLLSAAARRVDRAWDAYLSAWSLSHASMPVIALLVGGPRSQREIAEHLGVTEQTTSRLVAGLERSGYVRRTRDMGDRRRRVVEVTPSGLSSLRSLNVSDAIEGLVTHDLSADEVTELRRLLVRFVESTGQ